MSMTSPLGLMRHVHKPDLRMEVIPWLNVLLVGAMMYLLSSSYIWAPGIVVSNSAKTSLPASLHLPTLPTASQTGTASLAGHPDATLVILPPQFSTDPVTKQRTTTQFFILNNGQYGQDDLPQALKSLRKILSSPKPSLLVKGDVSVSLDTTLKVLALAQAAGFESEIWAFMPADSGNNPAAAPASGSAAPPPAQKTP